MFSNCRFLSNNITELSNTCRDFLTHKRTMGRKLITGIGQVNTFRAVTSMLRKISFKRDSSNIE